MKLYSHGLNRQQSVQKDMHYKCTVKMSTISQKLTRQLQRLHNQQDDPNQNSVFQVSTGHSWSAVSCCWSAVVSGRWPRERPELDRRNLLDDQQRPLLIRSAQPTSTSAGYHTFARTNNQPPSPC